jgi:Protein of unknown function (DUF5672)
MLVDHAVIGQRLRLPDVTLACIDTVNPELALYAVARSMAWIDFGAAVLITRPDHGLSDFPAGLQVIANETIRSLQDYSLFMLRGLSPHVKTSHCLVVQWDGFVLDPSMWSDDFLRFDYIGPVWERFSDDERCCCTGGFSLRSRRLLTALLDERIESRQSEDVCIALEYREYLERHHDIRYADKATACRFAIEDLYVSPAAFGFHGVHNLLCVLSSEEFEDFMVNAPDSVFASFRMRRFIKHALMQHEIDLAHRALLRRRSSRKLDMSDVRLWMRLYRARWSMVLGGISDGQHNV